MCPGEVGVGVVGLPVRIGGCAPLPTPIHLPLPPVHIGGHHNPPPVTVIGVTPGSTTDCGCNAAPPVSVEQPPATVIEQAPATVVQQAPPVTVQAPAPEQETDTVTAPAPEAPAEAPAPVYAAPEAPVGPADTGR
jgi:hypothetical protein